MNPETSSRTVLEENRIRLCRCSALSPGSMPLRTIKAQKIDGIERHFAFPVEAACSDRIVPLLAPCTFPVDAFTQQSNFSGLLHFIQKGLQPACFQNATLILKKKEIFTFTIGTPSMLPCADVVSGVYPIEHMDAVFDIFFRKDQRVPVSTIANDGYDEWSLRIMPGYLVQQLVEPVWWAADPV
mgnify:CR=1 FL=1